MLLWLIYKESPEFSYNSVMPKAIGLEASVQKTAELLQYYGDSVLKGEEWISNSMFTGHSQYVPPELPDL